MTFPLPRFEVVSRRQFLARSLAVGAVALIPGVACSNDDSTAFDDGTSDTAAPSTGAGSADPPGGDTTVAKDTIATDSLATDTTVAVASGDAFPSGAQLEVNFTFAAESGGRVRNPYVAVWIENPAGDLVQTLGLWYKSDEGKYVSHLKRWYNAEQVLLDAGGTDNVDAVSGATRAAGEYQLVWDGTSVDGATVAQGAYVVCIEAAREHGPYEIVTGDIIVGASAFDATLEASGELTAAAVNFVV